MILSHRPSVRAPFGVCPRAPDAWQGDRRVVVTGMGIVSCLGNTLEEVSASLHAAKPGIKFNEKYKEIGMKSHVCGTPDINCDDFIDRKQGRFMGINAKYAFIAMQQVHAPTPLDRPLTCRVPSRAPSLVPRRTHGHSTHARPPRRQAVADSGMTPEQMASPRVGGILGQGGTSIADIQDTLNAVSDGKLRRVGPYRVTRSMGSTVSAVLSTAFKLQGVSYSISSACSTGAHCI